MELLYVSLCCGCLGVLAFLTLSVSLGILFTRRAMNEEVDKWQLHSYSQDKCPVCLGSILQPISRCENCGTIYHVDCFISLASGYGKCANCKKSIRKKQPKSFWDWLFS